MTAATARILFVKIESSVAGEDPLRLCNAGQGFDAFPIDSPFGLYEPVGDLLTIDTLPSTSSMEAQNLSITLEASNDRILDYCLTPANVQDNGVCLHQSIGVSENEGEDYSLWAWGTPEIIYLGRISHVTLNDKGVQAVVYPASVDLSRITRTATKWADAQHQQLVHRGDFGFRHATRHGDEVKIEFG